jgi:hypothetical protein
MDNENFSSATGSVYDGMVCAYACPDTGFRPEPFTVPDFGKLSPSPSIADFRARFKALFIEMEEAHGKCLSVTIKHNEDRNDIDMFLNF